MVNDTDLLLVIGLALMVLIVPSMVSAWSDGRAPRVSAITFLIAGGMIAYSLTQAPGGGYHLQDIPEVITSVIGRFI